VVPSLTTLMMLKSYPQFLLTRFPNIRQPEQDYSIAIWVHLNYTFSTVAVLAEYILSCRLLTPDKMCEYCRTMGQEADLVHQRQQPDEAATGQRAGKF
jgi:hypothetical protein